MASVYIHIPFCQSRCIYCDFYSTTHIARQEQYVDCLLREMEQRQEEWDRITRRENSADSFRARTLSIYIGGGTPSTLPTTQLHRLLKAVTLLYPPALDAEITLEANPDDVTAEWVEALRQTPVNRVSMGVQTFDDTQLHTLRRRHSAEQAHEAVRLLREGGFHNISIDLIYGLPGQTLAGWQKDVDEAISLRVPHLSAYSLMYEEGTPLMRMLEEGKVSEMDDDLSWQCYELLCKQLEKAGYQHYEISNFALTGFHSRHNSGYWQGTPYLGFGAGAHSYDGADIRRSNVASLNDYIASLSGDSTKPYFENEKLSQTDLYNEFVMTRLRTNQGISLDRISSLFGRDALAHCTEMMKPHLQKGNLSQTGSVVCLTRKGIFVSNDVISDLFL